MGGTPAQKQAKKILDKVVAILPDNMAAAAWTSSTCSGMPSSACSCTSSGRPCGEGPISRMNGPPPPRRNPWGRSCLTCQLDGKMEHMSERLSKVPEVAHTKEDLGEIMEDACKLCTGLSSEGAHLVGMKLTRLVLDYISYI